MNDQIEQCRKICGATVDIAKLLNGLHRLYSVKDVREYPSVMMEVAEELVPCLHSSVDTVELASGRATNVFSRPTALTHDEFMSRWSVLCHEHPGIKHIAEGGQASVLAISDFVTQRELRKTAFYNELFKACGAEYQLGVLLPVPGFVAGMALNRDSDFSSGERQLIELLHPHFVQAFQNAQLYTSVHGEPDVDFGVWRRNGFTRRECEVLRWVVAGKRNAEIAAILEARPRTISKHVENILAKFHVETRSAAAAEARRLLGDATVLPI